MLLLIDPQGTVRCLYAEMIDLSALGPLAIRRASHVEPDATGKWWANLAPVAGPPLGPFNRRSEALQAEETWLTAHWLAPPDGSEGIPRGDRALKVVAIVEGGVVQGALSNHPDIALEVLDHDNYVCEGEINGESEAQAEARLTKEFPHTIY